jgi:Holliday junction DNA helicase RuvA
MIAHIQGRLHFKSPEHLIIDVDGIGYQVHVPLTTFYELPDVGNTVALHIHTHVREDALQLYGFQAQEEKTLFIRLMGVAARLISIPGVGRKTAERIMLEMRDKLPALAADRDIALSVKSAAAEAVMNDAISALVNLGYKKGVAQRAIDQAQQRLQGEMTLESLLKESLRALA